MVQLTANNSFMMRVLIFAMLIMVTVCGMWLPDKVKKFQAGFIPKKLSDNP